MNTNTRSDHAAYTVNAMAGAVAVASGSSHAVIAQAQTATPRTGMIVSTTWLAGHIRDANLVVLHVGNRAGSATAAISPARDW